MTLNTGSIDNDLQTTLSARTLVTNWGWRTSRVSRAELSLKFQVAGYMQLIGGELYSLKVLLVLFSFCFVEE